MTTFVRARLKVTDYARLKAAFEQLELSVAGVTARFDYLCCDECAAKAMETRFIVNYVAATGEQMDKSFAPVMSELELDDKGEYFLTCLGREPDMKAPLRLVHHWGTEDPTIRREVVSLLNNFGFLVEWDLSDDKAIILHN